MHLPDSDPTPSNTSRRKKAAFIDRDGVLNKLVDRGPAFHIRGIPVRWTAPFNREEIRFVADVREALNILVEKGYTLILVTNQPDVANGFITHDEFREMMAVFRTLPLHDIYACMHRVDAGCPCRKPKPQMLEQARDTHRIDMSVSWMLGDQESDIQAGKAAGVRTIFVNDNLTISSSADRRANDIMDAALLLP